jgi:hypothetical protein
MRSMVACDFIDLSDGQWHLLPQNAVNIVFEGVTGGHVDIITCHSPGVTPEHTLFHLNSGDNKDHHMLDPANGEFVFQNVKALAVGTDKIRVYFNRVKL